MANSMVAAIFRNAGLQSRYRNRQTKMTIRSLIGYLINTVTQGTTTGIITLTGDAWIVPCDYPAAFSTFTATIIASDSSYFDGHTLLTFECHENNTDNHPTVDYSKYGYYDGYRKSQDLDMILLQITPFVMEINALVPL